MIVVNNFDHGHAIAASAWCTYNPAGNVCIAREEKGRLLAGVIYGAHTGPAIWAHLAVFERHGLNRDFIYAAVSYPFNQLGVSKILAQIPSTNVKALEFVRKFRFNTTAIVPDAVPDGDLIIVSLLRENCRWL